MYTPQKFVLYYKNGEYFFFYHDHELHIKIKGIKVGPGFILSLIHTLQMYTFRKKIQLKNLLKLKKLNKSTVELKVRSKNGHKISTRLSKQTIIPYELGYTGEGDRGATVVANSTPKFAPYKRSFPPISI